jgi:hypothetical protein
VTESQADKQTDNAGLRSKDKGAVKPADVYLRIRLRAIGDDITTLIPVRTSVARAGTVNAVWIKG